jgi:hypothetical protein
MLSAIKFRGDVDALSRYARERLIALRRAVEAKHGFLPEAHTPSRMLGRGRGGLPSSVLLTRYTVARPPSLLSGYIVIGRYHIANGAALGSVVVLALTGTGIAAIASWVVRALT